MKLRYNFIKNYVCLGSFERIKWTPLVYKYEIQSQLIKQPFAYD